MFSSSNPATWTPREARSEAGTLLCVCGVPGREFYVDDVEELEGQRFGVLRGACCDEHWSLYRNHTRPEDFDPMYCFAEEEPSPDQAPVTGFGPLFEGMNLK